MVMGELHYQLAAAYFQIYRNSISTNTVAKEGNRVGEGSKAGRQCKTIKIGNFSSCKAKNARFDTSFLATTPTGQAISLP